MAREIQDKTEKGYVLIYAVIILGSVVLSLAVYASWLAVHMVKEKGDLKKSKQAQYLADTCAELALQKIWGDKNFSGSGNASDFGGSCSYQVSNLGGENREIRSTGTVGNITRKAKVLVDRVSSKVNVATWQEVPDF